MSGHFEGKGEEEKKFLNKKTNRIKLHQEKKHQHGEENQIKAEKRATKSQEQSKANVERIREANEKTRLTEEKGSKIYKSGEKAGAKTIELRKMRPSLDQKRPLLLIITIVYATSLIRRTSRIDPVQLL